MDGRRSRRFGLGVATILVATVVRSQPVAAAYGDPPTPHLNRVGFNLGVASAVGGIGLSHERAFSPMFWLETGLGYGGTGTQLSLMPKVAFGGPTCRFVAGLGASLAIGGGGTVVSPGPSVIPWLNLDAAGLECRSGAGLSFEAAVGLTFALRRFQYDVADTGGTMHVGEAWPQGRLGLGWWF